MRKINPKNILIIFFIGIALVVLAPLLFTRDWTNFSFINTGQIGDTIGGITAPITSLIGSVLVYFALKAQIEANEQINEQIREQKESDLYSKKINYISEQINLIRIEISDFSEIELKRLIISRNAITPGNRNSADTNNHLIIKGPDALDYYLNRFCVEASHSYFERLQLSPKLITVINLLQLIESIANSIFTQGLKAPDKINLSNVLSFHFNSKIFPTINTKRDYNITESLECKSCGKKHFGIPREIFEITDNINLILNGS